MKKLITIFVLFISISIYSQTISNSIISSNGSYYSDNEMSFEYTVGEFTYTTLDNSLDIITQGFHQPNKFENQINNDINIDVFPNPTNDIVYLSFKNSDNSNVYISLYDIKGVHLFSKTIKNKQTSETLFLKEYANGIYQLIINSNNISSYYQIIKN